MTKTIGSVFRISCTLNYPYTLNSHPNLKKSYSIYQQSQRPEQQCDPSRRNALTQNKTCLLCGSYNTPILLGKTDLGAHWREDKIKGGCLYAQTIVN